MINIDFPKEGICIWLESVIDLRTPSPVVPIDETCCDEPPDPTIPLLIYGSPVEGVEKCSGAHAFTAWPPLAISDERFSIPIQRVIEPAQPLIPTVRNRLGE
jgi:hypothetical protein